MNKYDLHVALGNILHEDEFSTDERECADFSEDISGTQSTACALIRPSSAKPLGAVVNFAAANRYNLIPRGSGHSYSGGVVPMNERSIIIDLTALNRILEIDIENRFVRVEAGCTWLQLSEELSKLKMRTPFFGPLSGFITTVGGALSQGAAFFGSGIHGYSERSVLGLAIVLSNGEVLRTGIGGDGRPHPRSSGPDLTGLFLGDCGAFGVKIEATLHLIEITKSEAYASFNFKTMQALLRTQAKLAGFPGLSECFGFDVQSHINLTRGGFTIIEGAQIVKDTVLKEKKVSKKLNAVRQLVITKKRSISDLQYSLHWVLEGDTGHHLDHLLRKSSKIAIDEGGDPLPDTIPRVTRSKPFRPIKALLGADGERWLPLHGIFRLSDAIKGYELANDFLTKHLKENNFYDVKISFLTVLSGNSILVEPHLFWQDSLTRFHRRYVTDEQRRKYGQVPSRPEARTYVYKLRDELRDILDSAGAEHLQVGRYYRYFDKLDHPNKNLVRNLKLILDSQGVMAPGVLLDEHDT